MRTGIRRKVDDLGRVVIPAGIRRTLNIREGDAVEVHVEGDRVIFSKPIEMCVFCGTEDALQAFRNKRLCRSCIAALGVMDEDLRSERHQERDEDEPFRTPLPPWPLDDQPRRHTAERPLTGQRSGPRPVERPAEPAASERRFEREVEPVAADRGHEPPASSTAW